MAPDPIPSALVGHTGFIGQNLRAQRHYGREYHRANLKELQGGRFDRLVICAMPAEKWRINQAPEADLANLRQLQDALAKVHARQVVLVSTVDVFAQAIDVDECTRVHPGEQTPYGAHRLIFERWLGERFEHCHVLRLPGVFGRGLKKNVLFDLLHGNAVDRVHPDGLFQWYPVSRLADDIDRLCERGLALAHAAVAPLRSGDIAARFFPNRILTCAEPPAANYRMRTVHDHVWGGADGYWLDADAAMDAIAQWLHSEPSWICAGPSVPGAP